ncbi:MAG: putative transcriptional regulator [Bacteroidetes bacterium]|nr:putative transcriptional regulator [Bacteroidota bacterium]
MKTKNLAEAVTFVHRENATAARKAIYDEDTLLGLSETFKVLGDVTRLKICLALSRSELCVGDIAGLLLLSDSAVSHQLRTMKTMRLVKYRKEGKMTYYMLDDEHIEDLIRLGVRHVSEY